jgi:hypothetical protein
MKQIIPLLVALVGLVGLAELGPPCQAQALKPATETASSPVPTNSLVAVARPVRVFDVTVFNSHTADLYIHIFDATATPAAGTVPLAPLKLLAGETRSYSWDVASRKFTNGVVVAASTTPATFTNAGAVFLIDVTYSIP